MIASHEPQAGHDVVAAAIEGDRRALDALWQAHRRWIAAVLLTYKPREADLEDLLQDVAMRLISKISTLREEANVRAWLRTVAVNVARSEGRARRPSKPLDDDTAGAPACTRDAAGGVRDEDTGRLMELLARLPDHYREPLTLRVLHGMRAREIAAILEVPPATVDTRIARARRMLREQAELEGLCAGAGESGPRS